jgi:hypothetical protein
MCPTAQPAAEAQATTTLKAAAAKRAAGERAAGERAAGEEGCRGASSPPPSPSDLDETGPGPVSR